MTLVRVPALVRSWRRSFFHPRHSGLRWRTADRERSRGDVRDDVAVEAPAGNPPNPLPDELNKMAYSVARPGLLVSFQPSADRANSLTIVGGPSPIRCMRTCSLQLCVTFAICTFLASCGGTSPGGGAAGNGQSGRGGAAGTIGAGGAPAGNGGNAATGGTFAGGAGGSGATGTAGSGGSTGGSGGGGGSGGKAGGAGSGGTPAPARAVRQAQLESPAGRALLPPAAPAECRAAVGRRPARRHRVPEAAPGPRRAVRPRRLRPRIRSRSIWPSPRARRLTSAPVSSTASPRMARSRPRPC